MSKFRVGDRAIVLSSYDARTVGAVSTVVDIRQPASAASEWLRSDGSAATVPAGSSLVGIDGAPLGFGRVTYYEAANLGRLPDDGHLAGEWTDELRRLCEPKVNA